MLKNIYGPLSGAKGQERILEIIANNLANINTTAYKEDQLTFESVQANPWDAYSTPLPPAPFKQDMTSIYPLHGNEMGYAAVSELSVAHVQGGLQKTNNPLDAAIQGGGFFSVLTPFGQRFTRDGAFTVNAEGTLITRSGAAVQGEKGNITNLSEGTIKILPSGEVYSGSQFIDKIKLTNFKDHKMLQRLGNNLFVHDGQPENMVQDKNQISQGYLENSNVNPMRNLTNMIVAHRNYEALQRAIKSHDESMQIGANKIGEVQR